LNERAFSALAENSLADFSNASASFTNLIRFTFNSFYSSRTVSVSVPLFVWRPGFACPPYIFNFLNSPIFRRVGVVFGFWLRSGSQSPG
jgi:hypothetical protein